MGANWGAASRPDNSGPRTSGNDLVRRRPCGRPPSVPRRGGHRRGPSFLAPHTVTFRALSPCHGREAVDRRGPRKRKESAKLGVEKMARPKPWFKVVAPRDDLREARPLDASEFAVHLDHIRENRAPRDYVEPDRFLARTYLTDSLKDLAAQTVRRLSGNKVETSAVFNLATQFGGGKTHALTLLYHLARAGEKANTWQGVRSILDRADVSACPRAATAVFVGTEFDSITGRGGRDGEPLRLTPWGEIAWQLGGAEGFAKVARHDAEFIEPKGDVIRSFLPQDRPALILMDEIINYVSTYRGRGYHNKLYNFVQALSETARAMDNVVLIVSIPASELEYTTDDQADETRFKKMLDRVGRAMMMSAEAETSEIISRRLFDWEGTPPEARAVAADYADFIR